MSDTPTFANLLTQWSTGGPDVREEIYAHLRAAPAEAAAVEAFLRDQLNAALPWRRVAAAEAMLAVYHDDSAAAGALAWVLRQGDWAADAIAVLRKIAPERAAPLVADFALLAPEAFRALASDHHKWAGETAARCGERGAELWLTLFHRASATAESALLMGLADGATRATCDLLPTLDAVRARLLLLGPGYAAGAALWRITWRVNRDWLASIDPQSPQLENDSLLLAFLIEVLVEHLGRRPDLTALVSALLVRLGTDAPERFAPTAARLASLGARGWSTLLPILGNTQAPALARADVFRQVVKHAKVWPLAHHHAHNVILERARDRTLVPDELLEAAGMVLYSLDRAAGSAVPDLLDLIVKQPDTAKAMTRVVAFTVSGCPNPAAMVARTLDRLRRSVVFAPDAFVPLAKLYASLDLDGAPALVEDTSLDPRTPETLLQQPAWKDAPPEVRQRHALRLANSQGSPRPEVRARAADALRHYPDQLPTIWPALVALLAGGDEKAVLLVLPLFRHLAPVSEDVTTELRELFRETNPTYAARAVVALWRLGRMPLVAAELREAVTSASGDAWGWIVLRGAVDRAMQAHGLLHDLSHVFAAAPQEIAAKVSALLNPPELEEERAIAVHVPRPNDPTSPQMVNWSGVHRCVGNEPEGGLLFLALMCAFGSAEVSAQKIWLVKHQRVLTGTGLAEAKSIVERAIEQLTVTATPGEKRACVRGYFPSATALPNAITELLEHRINWYRWAGLELLDAWGAPERVPELIEDRVWDRSSLVRTRALRMNHGS